MNVPRGTPPVTRSGAWRVVCLHLPRPWRLAVMKGLKTELRVQVSRDNCIVSPGKFQGVDFSRGHARHGEVPQLRAPHTFASRKSRSVTITPKFGRGDLLWVRTPRGRRDMSRFTLEVLSVDVVRLRDMTDAAARAEGVGALPLRLRSKGSPRDWFSNFWTVQFGARAWRLNPWVWHLTFRVHEEQVDELLARWGKQC